MADALNDASLPLCVVYKVFIHVVAGEIEKLTLVGAMFWGNDHVEALVWFFSLSAGIQFEYSNLDMI